MMIYAIVVFDDAAHVGGDERDEPESMGNHFVREHGGVFLNFDLIDSERINRRNHHPAQRVGQPVTSPSRQPRRETAAQRATNPRSIPSMIKLTDSLEMVLTTTLSSLPSKVRGTSTANVVSILGTSTSKHQLFRQEISRF